MYHIAYFKKKYNHKPSEYNNWYAFNLNSWSAKKVNYDMENIEEHDMKTIEEYSLMNDCQNM